jgi:hypothetical protein
MMSELPAYEQFNGYEPTVPDPEAIVGGMVAVVMRREAELDGGGSARVVERPDSSGGGRIVEKPGGGTAGHVSDKPVESDPVEEAPEGSRVPDRPGGGLVEDKPANI